MISKPIAPPWNDSSKNLVKDLALAGRTFRYHVLTPKGYTLAGPRVQSEAVYARSGEHTPALRQNANVVHRLLRPDKCDVSHFFYAPNPRTSLVARACLTLRPRRTVQTICSRPRSFERVRSLLFADRIVTLSQDTKTRVEHAGVPTDRLRLIRPGIQLPVYPTADERRAARAALRLPLDEPIVIYPGDYQFSSAAHTTAEAMARCETQSAHFVFACRIKQHASREEEARVDSLLRRAGIRARATLLNEVPQMLKLLAAADLCVLPAESLFAKMDIPLVLIEALALGVPVVTADRPPANELLQLGDVGGSVPPGDPLALARVIDDILANESRRRILAKTAREVARNFDIEDVSRQHEALYDELLTLPQPPLRIGRLWRS
jgi:phosphatidylinositol alpha-1,6-mannosyltransferase